MVDQFSSFTLCLYFISVMRLFHYQDHFSSGLEVLLIFSHGFKILCILTFAMWSTLVETNLYHCCDIAVGNYACLKLACTFFLPKVSVDESCQDCGFCQLAPHATSPETKFVEGVNIRVTGWLVGFFCVSKVCGANCFHSIWWKAMKFSPQIQHHSCSWHIISFFGRGMGVTLEISHSAE